jgi:UDP-N-acetylmuramoyl-tripeptide--D-alanyl-D-alanine ligase
LKALQDLAASVRAQSGAKFIGITGSSGKTSSKEFTAAILSEKYRVFKSEGNLNSVTGLPLTLLTLNQEECAVIEAGMNKPGEIAALSRIMKPDISVLLNINPVHLEGLQSLDSIADEKLSITEGMQEDGLVIHNADDALLCARVETVRQKKMSFGFSPKATLRIVDYVPQGVRGSKATFIWNRGSLTFETSLAGPGNMMNLAAAACVAIALNVSTAEILRGLVKIEPYAQRGVLLELEDIHIYDDSYNSNPKALELALQVLEESRGYNRRIAVVGDMLELGPEEIKFHEDAGKQMAAHHIDVLIAAGSRSQKIAETAQAHGVKQVFAVKNSSDAAEMALRIVQPGDLILVKGSRGMKMEIVIDALRKR